MRRALLGLTVLLVVFAGPRHPAFAVPVDLELVLAVDVSYSVDADEARLQREGYFTALRHPRVLQAVSSGPHRAIAVTYIEWAGSFYQRVVADWTVLRDAASIESFIARIAAVPQQAASRTSISGAIDFSARLFDDNGYEGTRLVIDVSGDGRNNHGRPARDARDAAVAKGITINGLPILSGNENFGRPAEEGLEEHYREEVIGGPGAFVIPAESFANFTSAILSKLVREIAGTLPQLASPAP
ncbi:MAG: DUF1194 domain-containing protein [Telmatospirillum sp.]|nr:DUF1194 domain-containing protein [Telmatospirillum sp.]